MGSKTGCRNKVATQTKKQPRKGAVSLLSLPLGQRIQAFLWRARDDYFPPPSGPDTEAGVSFTGYLSMRIMPCMTECALCVCFMLAKINHPLVNSKFFLAGQRIRNKRLEFCGETAPKGCVQALASARRRGLCRALWRKFPLPARAYRCRRASCPS